MPKAGNELWFGRLNAGSLFPLPGATWPPATAFLLSPTALVRDHFPLLKYATQHQPQEPTLPQVEGF